MPAAVSEASLFDPLAVLAKARLVVSVSCGCLLCVNVYVQGGERLAACGLWLGLFVRGWGMAKSSLPALDVMYGSSRLFVRWWPLVAGDGAWWWFFLLDGF